ncbi:MAG: histidine--tRNA ligase family protein [Chloroflexi bacterium]|nr:histidine--tRNA ligase family protein [Chloroflexota bacterium]
MKVERCKGTRDLSPEEMRKFRFIESVFQDCCLKGGYEEVRTPTLEYLHLFTATGTLTPSMLSKVYSFLDWDGWSGERVVLRPDGTIPVARFYIDSLADKGLAKLFYITNIFIFEETGKETRERWQCGTELLGANSAAADVELIALALEVLTRLGLKGIEIRLSHAGLLKALLAKLELSRDEQHTLFDKMMDGETEVLARIKESKPELGDALSLLLNMKGESSGFLRNLKALLNHNLADLAPAIDNFIGIADLLSALGHDYQIDLSSGRGFEYYTGVIFQLFKDDEKIGSGGRYDDLIPLMGGKKTPASGFALYLDHLMKLVTAENLTRHQPHRILIQPETTTLEAEKECFSLAGCLREAGYIADFNLGGRKPMSHEWSLIVKCSPSRFVLTDPARHKRFELETPADVLAIIGG